MLAWKNFKKGFDIWEAKTAEQMQEVLSSNLVLWPAAAVLSFAAKTKAASDNALSLWWSNMGLPTRDGQERSLHSLNQLESRLLDLEEQIADMKKEIRNKR